MSAGQYPWEALNGLPGVVRRAMAAAFSAILEEQSGLELLTPDGEPALAGCCCIPLGSNVFASSSLMRSCACSTADRHRDKM